MKRLFRWLFRLLILAIVLLVALVLLKDIIIKAVVEARLREATGMSVTIERLELGLMSLAKRHSHASPSPARAIPPPAKNS